MLAEVHDPALLTPQTVDLLPQGIRPLPGNPDQGFLLLLHHHALLVQELAPQVLVAQPRLPPEDEPPQQGAAGHRAEEEQCEHPVEVAGGNEELDAAGDTVHLLSREHRYPFGPELVVTLVVDPFEVLVNPLGQQRVRNIELHQDVLYPLFRYLGCPRAEGLSMVALTVSVVQLQLLDHGQADGLRSLPELRVDDAAMAVKDVALLAVDEHPALGVVGALSGRPGRDPADQHVGTHQDEEQTQQAHLQVREYLELPHLGGVLPEDVLGVGEVPAELVCWGSAVGRYSGGATCSLRCLLLLEPVE